MTERSANEKNSEHITQPVTEENRQMEGIDTPQFTTEGCLSEENYNPFTKKYS